MLWFQVPLGNLTSQLLANVYMHEFDWFMKQSLHVEKYIRYADDFVVLSSDKEYLLELLQSMQDFLSNVLKLELHLDKIELKTLADGIDFLGWVHFPHHRILRRVTQRRAYAKIQYSSGDRQVLDSYLGLVSYGDAFEFQQKMKNLVFLLRDLQLYAMRTSEKAHFFDYDLLHEVHGAAHNFARVDYLGIFL